MLDVISGGRLEFGVGRGYQPREVEVFGVPVRRQHPGPGAQPRLLPRGLRDHHQGLDRSRPSRTTASSSPSRPPTPAGTTPRRSPTSASRMSAARSRTSCGSARRTTTAAATRSRTPPPCSRRSASSLSRSRSRIPSAGSRSPARARSSGPPRHGVNCDINAIPPHPAAQDVRAYYQASGSTAGRTG